VSGPNSLAASRFEIELMPDHSVRITLRCASAYEAAILFDEVSTAAKSGLLAMSFQTKNVGERGAPK